MTRLIAVVAWALLCLVPSTQAPAQSWDTVVFREDFDSSVGGMPDPGEWVVNDPENWARAQGRTYFPCPNPWFPDGSYPLVDQGKCTIEHHLFNSMDPDPPYDEFLGGEIHTVLEFEPNQSYLFEAKVKCHLESSEEPCPSGLVPAFFVYGYDGSKHDEIDFELITKPIATPTPECAPVLTNPWNESWENPIYFDPPDFDLSDWTTLRIYWYPEVAQVEWWWLRPGSGSTWLRTETNAGHVPDEPMAVYFNFWAPPSGWSCPFDESLQPIGPEGQDLVAVWEIDYVEVRTDGALESRRYVDDVVSQAYGNCCDPDVQCHYTPASRALGGPDWSEYKSVPGEWWKASPGEGGEIIVRFNRAVVIDGPGADFRIWQGGGGGGETALLAASYDGAAFSDFSTPLDDDVHSGGDAAGDGFYVDFDLAEMPLDAIRYLKIVDVVGDDDGSDIDAIEVLNRDLPTVSSGGLLLLSLLVASGGAWLLIRRSRGVWRE